MMQTALRENDAVSTAPALTPVERRFLENYRALPPFRRWLERQYVRLWYWRIKASGWLGGLVVLVMLVTTGRD